ncbi:MAG: hypothetical protein IJ981_02000, partial [Clostridia bacterium]|nr:hypothetical protein [Clostridia bacterium]
GKFGMDGQMKDYLIKVGLKTLVFLLAITIILSSVLMLFVPAYASDVCYNLGLKDLSARLEVNAYIKSEDLNDLAKLFDRAVDAENYEITYKFGKELFNHKDIDEYSLFRAKYGSLDYKSYVLGNYAIATANLYGVNSAVDLLEENTGTYSRTCAYSYLVSHVCEKTNKFKKDDATLLLNSLESRFADCSEEEKVFVSSDGYYLCQTFGLGNGATWQERYKGQ